MPRLTQLSVPVTTDEPLWFERSTQFGSSVLSHNWAGTYQTGHPGVTTMWTAALSMGLEAARSLDGAQLTLRARREREAFLASRRGIAVVGSVLLGVIVFLAGRALGVRVAALAGPLLALDPWLVGHGRVLHVDWLLTALTTIAVLACLVRWQAQGGVAYLALAGLAAGLAAITKSAALVLLPPLLGLLAVGHAWQAPAAWRWRIVRDLVALAGLAGLAAFLAWPALLTDPLGVIAETLAFGEHMGEQPHGLGSFFLGQPADDPGLAFYPVALAFRLSVPVLAGLLAWPVGWRVWRRRGQPSAGDLSAWLLACAAIVLLVMTVAAKKQDRYVLPAVPLLVIVSAVGFQRFPLSASAWRGARPLLLGGLGLAQLLLCASVRPYFFNFYSPLLGGAPMARQMLLVGWSEGLAPAAEYLNRLPEDPRPSVTAPDSVRLAFRAQTRARVLDPALDLATDYALTYVNAEQRGQEPPDDPRARLVLTVRVDGVDYARLYALS